MSADVGCEMFDVIMHFTANTRRRGAQAYRHTSQPGRHATPTSSTMMDNRKRKKCKGWKGVGTGLTTDDEGIGREGDGVVGCDD